MLLVPGLCTAWYATRAVAVASDLIAAREALGGLGPEHLFQDDPALEAALARAHRRTAAAASTTGGPSWTALTYLPGPGRLAGAVRDMAGLADELSGAVLPDLLTARRALQAHGTAGLTAGISAAAPPLRDADRRLTATQTRLPPVTGIGPLDRARSELVHNLARLRTAVSVATAGTEVLPAMLGDTRPRRYFLAFQTPAEARGTGGLVGAYGILVADRGRLHVETLKSDSTLVEAKRPVADLGPEFRKRYGYMGALRELTQSNLSPHFPYAARIWTGMWHDKVGQRLDGAIAVDPSGLAELLKAIGPVRIPGGIITADNAVQLTQRDVYARFHDQEARKRYLIKVAEAVAEAAVKKHRPTPALMRAFARMAADGRLRMWSARPAEQAWLARTSLSGMLPDASGPYAQVVVNNAGGNKLDHYLERAVRYELGPCTAEGRSTRVTIRLTNAAPSKGLPSYVTYRSDLNRQVRIRGTSLLWVSFYAARGARLEGASADGGRVGVGTGTERGHPVFSVMRELRPGQSTTLVFALTEPKSDTAPVVAVQPLTRPQQTRVSTVAGC